MYAVSYLHGPWHPICPIDNQDAKDFLNINSVSIWHVIEQIVAGISTDKVWTDYEDWVYNFLLGFQCSVDTGTWTRPNVMHNKAILDPPG